MHFSVAKTWKNLNQDPAEGYPILMSGNWVPGNLDLQINKAAVSG